MQIISHESTGETSKKILISIKENDENIIFNNSNYNNIIYYLKNPMSLNDEKHEFLVSLSKFEIPISWPLISSYIGNNFIEYIINGVTYNFTIPDGSYSSNDLKSLLNTNLELSVIYEKTTGKLIFSHPTYNFSITNNTTCFYELGFRNITYNSTDFILSSSYAIDLAGTREIYIRTNLLVSNIDSRNGSSNIIDSVSIDVNNYNVLKYKNTEGFKSKIKDKLISFINTILEDYYGREIDINHNWNITFEIDKIINNNIPDIDTSKIMTIDDIES